MESQFLSVKENQGKVKVFQALNGDDIQLLETFPEEVWLHILDKIWEPETLFNLSAAALFWKRLLHPQRIHYLLPQVLEILAVENHFFGVHNSELLEWRCVCKSWKFAVNMLLVKDHDIERQTFPKHAYHLRGRLWWSMSFQLYNRDNINRVQAFKNSDKFGQNNLLLDSASNFIPSRYLSINLDEFEELCDISRSIAKCFLERMGRHFLHATFWGEREHGESYYNTISDHVSLLPDLKSLEVGYIPRSNTPPCVVLKSFPTVSNLQVLKFWNCNCACAKRVLATILQANPQINVLELTCASSTGLEFPQLKSLHTWSVSITSAVKQVHLPQLPNLKMLRLGFGLWKHLNGSIILSKLPLYRDTLVELCLELPCICAPKGIKNRFLFAVFHQEKVLQSSSKTLDLPNVKTLELSIRSCCSLDLLLGLQSLECLRMNIVYDSKLSAERAVGLETSAKYNIIKFRHTEDPVMSNIWQLIPSLKILELRTYCSGKPGSPTRIRTYNRESTPKQTYKKYEWFSKTF